MVLFQTDCADFCSYSCLCLWGGAVVSGGDDEENEKLWVFFSGYVNFALLSLSK